MVIASDFETRSYKSLFFRFGRQFLFFIVCLFTAAGIIYAIEKNAYEKSKQNASLDLNAIEADRARETEKFLNTTGFPVIKEFVEKHGLETEKMKEFIHELHKKIFYKENTTIPHYYEDMYRQTTYLEAYVLILSVITTVGWGHVTPITIGAKAFTALVAILGIPLFFMMIVSGSQIVIRLVKNALRFCCRDYRTDLLYKPLICAIIFVYIMLTSAAIAAMEGFEYQAALWYSVMSLTTVGFGDVIQYGEHLEIKYGKEARDAGLAVFLLFWLVTGFILIGALVLGVIYDNWGDKKTVQFKNIYKGNNDEELIENIEEDLDAPQY